MTADSRRSQISTTAFVGVVLAVLLTACALPEGSPVKLAGSDAFDAYVTQDRHLVVLAGELRSTTSDYASPPQLREASVEYLQRDGMPVTAVAGPIHDRVERVIATSGEGRQAEAAPVEAFGWRWFWIELPGHVTLAELVAVAENGTTLETLDSTPIPPPPDES